MSTTADEYLEAERRGIELEYTALKNEMLKRIEMRQQIIAVTLAFAGAFLGVGLKIAHLALIYPPLAALMALGWAQNDFRVGTAARYIREHLESSMPGLRYETRVQMERAESKGLGAWLFVVLSHGGIFMVTQIMAVVIHILVFPFNTLVWILLGVDGLSLLVVAYLMFLSLRQWRQTKKPQ